MPQEGRDQMRKVLMFAVPLFAVASFGIADAARNSASVRTAVCDLTTSKTTPYKRVVATTAKALKAYTAKAADIIPATKACPKTLLTATSGGVAYTTTMVGVTEMPTLGDADGTGTVTVRLRAGQGQVCTTMTVANITTPTASHIHKGDANSSGPVVVPLKTPGLSGATGGCVTAARSVVTDILANHGNYYVNVHTADFPDGAIRGSLSGAVPYILTAAPMTGAAEKPTGTSGDSDGTGVGMFILRPDTGQLCYTLSSANIILPATASHIHRGDGTASGPVIIPFTAPAANGQSSACVTVDAGLLKEIIGNPGGFYANIHTTDFPAGAIRAPLTVLR
jgi:hypothetical protein